MTHRIVIDQDLCISSGRCVADAPALFGFDDDELAVVVGDADQLDQDRLIRVARSCPGQAISIVTADGDEVPLD